MTELDFELNHELDHELHEIEFYPDDLNWLWDYVNDGQNLWEEG